VIRREDYWPLGSLGILILVTASWWALALWPVPAAPAWLERTRAVCFNAGPTGLPDRSGWVLLIGEPLGMIALLLAGWRARVAASLARLISSRGGRTLSSIVVIGVVGGLVAAGARVLSARVPPATLPGGPLPGTYPRLDRSWPSMVGLVDQDGEPFSLERLGGRPVFVTFAYAHCGTVCPIIVRSALSARAQLAGERDLAVVALTLDPWRDTPARLPSIAAQWQLAPGDFALSGSLEDVERALDAWQVPRERDEHTGDLTHPALVYLVEPDGTVAYGSSGATDQLVALARRLR
jgi:protein SCO1/2